jgi:hypothetical protein
MPRRCPRRRSASGHVIGGGYGARMSSAETVYAMVAT